MSARRKLVVICVSIPGIAVLLVGGYLLVGVIREASYLSDLATYDEVRSREAAEWLGRHGSVRAMRRLFDLARELLLRPDVEDVTSGSSNSVTLIGEAMERIAVTRRREVVPLLSKILGEAPSAPTRRGQIRIGAAKMLEKIGPDAQEALPALEEALKDDDDDFRGNVIAAMESIRRLQ